MFLNSGFKSSRISVLNLLGFQFGIFSNSGSEPWQILVRNLDRLRFRMRLGILTDFSSESQPLTLWDCDKYLRFEIFSVPGLESWSLVNFMFGVYQILVWNLYSYRLRISDSPFRNLLRDQFGISIDSGMEPSLFLVWNILRSLRIPVWIFLDLSSESSPI